ncbi:MAG: HD domain-containing protein [archaeon]
MVDTITLLKKYYKNNQEALTIVLEHSKQVTKKALEIAKRMKEYNPDLKFIEEAAMLHDIGCFMTNAPEIHCHGKYPYNMHGMLGREILEKEGLPKHAIACEHHLGVGLTKEEAKKQGLPERDMIPNTIEEKIVAFADFFYSKHPTKFGREITIQENIEWYKKFGERTVNELKKWVLFFKEVDQLPEN